ncbi:MAG: hypothetical protein JWL90_3648 [Chthoniobacteraceae bacterium]|nr:hypothetical protein [Chthoniobacteraceae bacterium]
MEVQVIDKRPPLGAVIALAKAERDALLPKWRDDMAAMSAEVARKYFGALTEEAVRDGVEACVNLLSIGLLRSTSGGIEPAAWLQTFRAAGVRGVSKLAVELIKACDALPDYALVYSAKDEFRPSLLLQLLSQASKHGPARAYVFLMRETAERTEIKRQIQLAEWLLGNTSTGRIARRDMDRFFGTDSPDAEAAIHHVISLSCGAAKIDPYAESFNEDGPPEIAPHDLQVTRLAPKRLAEARKRYEDLVERIPADLRAALLFREKTWFDRFVLPTARPRKAGAPAEP